MSGAQVRKLLGTTNLADGEAIIRGWETDRLEYAERLDMRYQLEHDSTFTLPAPPPPKPTGPTVGQAVEQFLASRRDDGVRASTLKSYVETLRHLPASMLLSEVDLDWLEGTHRAKRLASVSQATWGKELTTLRAWQTWCVRRKMLSANAAKEIKKPRVKTNSTLPFTDEEVSALIGACQTAYERAAILVLLYSALRVSDVAALRRDALKPSGELELTIIKTGVDVKIPLNPAARSALLALPPFEGSGSAYFFHSGQCLPESTIHHLNMIMYRVGKRAGVANCHPHRFRDTCATSMLNAGADIRLVSRLLGHKSILITERHYSHWVKAQQDRLVEAMAKLPNWGLPSTT